MGQILIVEDDEDIRLLLADMLRDEGYDVATAANGAEALDALRTGEATTCAIILDLMMPTMNGWDFRAHQLRDPALARIPVIVMSGVADPMAAQTLAASAVVGKPLRLTDLLVALERHCPA